MGSCSGCPPPPSQETFLVRALRVPPSQTVSGCHCLCSASLFLGMLSPIPTAPAQGCVDSPVHSFQRSVMVIPVMWTSGDRPVPPAPMGVQVQEVVSEGLQILNITVCGGPWCSKVRESNQPPPPLPQPLPHSSTHPSPCPSPSLALNTWCMYTC